MRRQFRSSSERAIFPETDVRDLCRKTVKQKSPSSSGLGNHRSEQAKPQAVHIGGRVRRPPKTLPCKLLFRVGKTWERSPAAQFYVKSHRINGSSNSVRSHNSKVVGSNPTSATKPPRLFVAISIRVDYADWQIVMRLCQFPTAVLFAFKRGLVREKLFGNLGAMTGGGLILVRNHDAVFPSSVFARVKSWSINGVGCYIAQLLLPVENRDLILLEDLPEFIGVAQLHLVHPLDQVRFVAYGDRRTGRGLLATRMRDTCKQKNQPRGREEQRVIPRTALMIHFPLTFFGT